MKRFILILAGILVFSQKPGHCLTPQPIINAPSVSVSSVTNPAGGAVSVTVATPTAGSYSSGYFNYITHIHMEMYAAATLTGGAAPVTCTTTNLPGNPVFKFQSAEATGTDQIIDIDYSSPLQATQGAQVILTCPATASVIWNVMVNYFQGS